jgi:Tfp pilus assembly protein PilO
MNKRAPLIAAGIAILLVALTYLFLVKPKMAAVTDAQTQLATKQDEGSTLTTLLATLRDDQANASKFQGIIDNVDQRIPPLLDEQELITLLQHAGEQSGIDHLATQFGAPSVTSASGVSTVTVTLSIQGRYFTIAGFFDKIGTLPRAAKVTQFNVLPGGSVIGGVAPPGTMLAQATVEFYTSDTSAGPGSDPGSQPPAGFSPTPAPVAPSPSGAP